MKKGRFLHVPAESLRSLHGDQQMFGCLPLDFFFGKAVGSNLHGTSIIMNLAQNVLSVLSKCVCVCLMFFVLSVRISSINMQQSNSEF